MSWANRALYVASALSPMPSSLTTSSAYFGTLSPPLETAPDYYSTLLWSLNMSASVAYLAVSYTAPSPALPLYVFLDGTCYGVINTSSSSSSSSSPSRSVVALPGGTALGSLNLSTNGAADDSLLSLNITAYAESLGFSLARAEFVVEVSITATSTASPTASPLRAAITSIFAPLYAVQLALFEPAPVTNITYTMQSAYAAPVAPSDDDALNIVFQTNLPTLAPLLFWNVTSLVRWPAYLPTQAPTYGIQYSSDAYPPPLVVLPSHVTRIVYPRAVAVLQANDTLHVHGGFAFASSLASYQCVFYNPSRTVYSAPSEVTSNVSFSCTVPAAISTFPDTVSFFVTIAVAPRQPLANAYGLRGLAATDLTWPQALSTGGPSSSWAFTWPWLWAAVLVVGILCICVIRVLTNQRDTLVNCFCCCCGDKCGSGGNAAGDDDDESEWQAWPEAYGVNASGVLPDARRSSSSSSSSSSTVALLNGSSRRQSSSSSSSSSSSNSRRSSRSSFLPA